MLKIVINIYQELYSTRFKASNWDKFELEFFVGSFLMGAKHNFPSIVSVLYLLRALFSSNCVFPTQTEVRQTKVNTHTSTVCVFKIR